MLRQTPGYIMSRLLTLTLPVLICLSSLSCVKEESHFAELRGVWLTNVDSRVLESRERIVEAVEFLRQHNFNVIFPVVWNKSVTMYPSLTMERMFGILIDTLYRGRDPLAEVVEEAHARGIAVIPWFEFGFSSSYKKAGGPLLRARPDWAERDRSGALLSKNGFEWMNAFHPDVQEFMLSLVLEVVRGYDIDGVQGDDRLPALPVEGGYSEYTARLFAAEHQGEKPPDDFRDPEWVRWRAQRLSEFAERLAQEVRAVKPEVIISWSPSVYPWALEEYLQDWPAWIRSGSADVIVPQVYGYSVQEYKQTLDSQSPESLNVSMGRTQLFPAILAKVGSYVVPEDSLMAMVAYNRSAGYKGEVYFFYEGLRANKDALAKALLKRFYAQPAKLPFRAVVSR
jgi:uncharacterized lipoprotein YddW (UPF0748 family)